MIELLAIIVSVGLVLFVAMMSQARTPAGRVLSFSIALTSITVAIMFVFGQQSLLGVIVFGICPLIGSSVAMRVLKNRGVSPLTWGISAFLAGVAGAFAGFYLGFTVACMGGGC